MEHTVTTVFAFATLGVAALGDVAFSLVKQDILFTSFSWGLQQVVGY